MKSDTLGRSSYAKISRLSCTVLHILDSNITENLLKSVQFNLSPPCKNLYNFIFNLISDSQLSLPLVLVSLKYAQIYYLSKSRQLTDVKLIFLISVIAANKFLDDNRLANTWWSSISNIEINLLNKSELKFYKDLRFNLHLRGKEYVEWVEEMTSIGKWIENIKNEERGKSGANTIKSMQVKYAMMDIIEESSEKRRS